MPPIIVHQGRLHQLGALVLIWIERPPQVCRVIYHLDVHQEVHQEEVHLVVHVVVHQEDVHPEDKPVDVVVHQEVHLVVHVEVHQEDVRVVVHQEVVHLVVHLEDRVGGIGDNCHR